MAISRLRFEFKDGPKHLLFLLIKVFIEHLHISEVMQSINVCLIMHIVFLNLLFFHYAVFVEVFDHFANVRLERDTELFILDIQLA